MKKNKKICIYIIAANLLLIFVFIVTPIQKFNVSYSKVLYSSNGNILSAKIATDEQWRFPSPDSVPYRYKQALLAFEDKRFYRHPGVDIRAMFRATYQNITNWTIVSGGSTISMQVIRLLRKNKSRTIIEKLIEIAMALKLELYYSKDEILKTYCTHAPYGGNTVGLNAASWRYFKRPPGQLSWAESALLAVLPNSPSMIHPGRNRLPLKKKRDRLLLKLHEKKRIDSTTYELSVEEPLPEKPAPLPQIAPHLMNYALSQSQLPEQQSALYSTVDFQLQKKSKAIIDKHHTHLKKNRINNIAALILEVESGKVLAYQGNFTDIADTKHGYQVDVIQSPRSTGSILKPFLYAGMLTTGEILPNALVPDIPTRLGGFRPQNYNLGFSGALPARKALARSLNVPAVRLLRNYGVERFYFLLEQLGLTTLTKNPDHYGLSIILGGCEGTLWEIAGSYASMARILNNYQKHNAKYNPKDFHPPVFVQDKTLANQPLLQYDYTCFSASAIYHTFQALLEVERPSSESGWRAFASSGKIAWKTGTSFGFRDAWSIGVTPNYVVAVWVGNADGEGRPGLTGVTAAAPVLFDLFDILPHSNSWFPPPHDDMELFRICHSSGFLASDICPKIDTVLLPLGAREFDICPYHQKIHLDFTETYRVNSSCYPVHKIKHSPWFVLPSIIEHYYSPLHPEYEPLPPFRDNCNDEKSSNNIGLIYPYPDSEIFIPVELNGQPGNAIFEAAHRQENSTLFWYIDNKFLGKTTDYHQMAIHATKGEYTLTLVDNSGEELKTRFKVINEKKTF